MGKTKLVAKRNAFYEILSTDYNEKRFAKKYKINIISF